MILKWLSKCLLLYFSSSNSTENEGHVKLEINVLFTGLWFQVIIQTYPQCHSPITFGLLYWEIECESFM